MSATSPISLLSPAEESPPLIDTKSDAENAGKENTVPAPQLPEFVYTVTSTKSYPWYEQDTPDTCCVGTYLDLEDAKNAAWDQMSDRSYPEIYEESNGVEMYLERDPGSHDRGTTAMVEAVRVHKPGSVPRSKRRRQAEEKKRGGISGNGKAPKGVKKDTTSGQKPKKRKRSEWEMLAD